MPKKNEDQQKIEELTSDLQRTRADFENYRKRIDIEKTQAREMGQISAIMKLLPVIDNIERAISYVPAELEDNQWAQAVKSLTKNLEKSIENMGISRIDSTPGTVFNPEFHDAIQFDEDATGETEIIEESLQPGYMLNGVPIRHAMVKVTKK